MLVDSGLLRQRQTRDRNAVGEACLGRLFNLQGEPLDGKGPVEAPVRWPIHRDAPNFEDQQPVTEVFLGEFSCPITCLISA